MNRNVFRYKGFALEKLAHQEDISLFDCGDTDLNNYFHKDCVLYRLELMTQTYCFYREDSTPSESLAIVDFCNDSLARNFIPNSARRKINHNKRGYRSFPALKITRLGVNKKSQGCGVGSILLDAIKLFFITDNRSGCRFLTLDAYRQAQGFYEKNGFITAQLPEDDENIESPTIPMFFDLARIMV